ncbi:LysR family transcriptional regulator [Streptomyces phaeolivaceus]|uniref:LysR family transcriptional regulator n=1 Tax=Streptomyces phaeolivaceus TaxID=2653200 RepID=UPI0018698010|nr:LysR family transcriptional regulator [Streptomyces phaeolivaceus]
MLEENPAPQTRIAAPSKHAARQVLSAGEFSRLYRQKRLSLQEISELTGFSRGTLTALALEYGIALRPAGGRPRHEMVERDWLLEEYVIQRRPLSELAQERGVSKATMCTWARLHRIPMRSSGGASHGVALRTARLAEAAPAFLRPAMTSAYSCERLLRFAQAVEHRTLRSAANQIGCGEDTLAIQIRRLEHDLGGPLLDPFENGRPLQPTGLGKQVLKALERLNAEELDDLVKHRPGGRPEQSPTPPTECRTGGPIMDS